MRILQSTVRTILEGYQTACSIENQVYTQTLQLCSSYLLFTALQFYAF